VHLSRKARGTCCDCGASAGDRSRCPEHLATHAKRARAYREKQRDARAKARLAREKKNARERSYAKKLREARKKKSDGA
jgi:hypothetical protein